MFQFFWFATRQFESVAYHLPSLFTLTHPFVMLLGGALAKCYSSGFSGDDHIPKLSCFGLFLAMANNFTHSVLCRAQLHFLLIPAGIWKQENNCKVKSDLMQKEINLVYLYPSPLYTKWFPVLELLCWGLTGLDCLFCVSMQWMLKCWSNKVGKCFEV